MKLSRAKAVRTKCLDCCCGNAAEVRRCDIKTCPLWAFRMGSISRCGITLDEVEKLFSAAFSNDSAEETVLEEDHESEAEKNEE